LYKPSKKDNPTLSEMRIRIKNAMAKGDFIQNSITIEDLQEVEILQKRRKLSKGELSSMVFAKKTGQAFLTDDQKARRLASTYMDLNKVQTTPQLFGWLFYISVLSDSDKTEIINEHKKMDRPLEKYFNDIYMWALECRLASNY
jgi:predicted nucleic acid-binding protein